MAGLNPCFGGSWVMMLPMPSIGKALMGLNPCFGGSWVMIFLPSTKKPPKCWSLNPCFGGSWVMIHCEHQLWQRWKAVLILVLVEVGL